MGASAAEVLADRDWDVVVIGAGPAGLSAASALARERVAVLVLEEHDTIGDPVHCTGVLGVDAFDELELPRHTICAVVRTARFHGREGRSVDVEGDRIAAAVVDRGHFDRALSERALDDGAIIVRGARVRQVSVGARHATAIVDTSGAPSRRVRARVCILACGAQYRFNRQLGLGIPRAYVQTAQIETAFAPATVVEIDLNREIAPGGFAWLVPFRRGDAHMARIGLMATEGAAGCFTRHTESIARRHGVATVRSRPRLKILPLGPVKRTYTDRVLAVGDAAGLSKPTTGGGIYYSLLSGQFAAETLATALKHDRTDAAALRAYETQWQARLGPELRAGLAFRTLAARLDDRAIGALLELAAVDGIIPLLQRTGNFNWHRDAALALLRNPGFRRIVLSSFWS